MVLICIFLVRDVKHLSRYLLALCTSSLEKYVFFKSDFSLSLMLSCLSHLRNLDVNLLSDISFPKIFSHSVCDLFILLTVFSLCKIFLICIHLIYFCFCFSCLRHRQKNITEIILPMISSRSFMVSGLHLSV